MNVQSTQQLHQKAIIALNNNEIEKAHRYLVKLVQAVPNHADGYFLLAMVNVNVGQIIKATKLIDKAIRFNDCSEYRAQLAKCYALMGELTKAKESVKTIIVGQLSNALTADTIGVALSRVGLHQQAITYFEQAIKLDSENAAYQYNYGVSCKFIGEFKKATHAFEQAILLQPLHVAAHYALTDVCQIDENENHIQRLSAVKKQINHPDEQLHIGHALAREFQAIGEYDDAFAELLFAKSAKRKQVGYTFANDEKLFKTLTKQISQQSFSHVQGFDDDSAIFVVGMPRTGTTVVERMLTQSPDVHSAGELHDFALLTKQLCQDNSQRILNENILEEAINIDFAKLGQAYIHKAKSIRGCQGKFVDKMPLNVLYSQLILTALPKAKVICLDRNPLDTIISNFRQLFAANFSLYHYSLDLHDTYQFYLSFKELIERYVIEYPENFLIVSYESLVNAPSEIGQQIYEFCGLKWQADYAEIQNNHNPVDTASAVQVRKPIDNRHVGQWKYYQNHLLPIIDNLKALGFLVK